MRQCAELADLAMQLARATAKSALAALAEPETPAAPELLPDLTAEPPRERTPEPQSEPPPARALPRAGAGLYLRAPSCKPIHPALLFARLAAVARACIALEARLAAGAAPARGPDPRRAPLGEFLHHVTERLPDRAQQRRDATRRLGEMLTADPYRTMKTPEILTSICEELGIEIHLPTLPDEYLELLIDPADAEQYPPDPHATYPP